MLWETIKAFATQLDIEVDCVFSLTCYFSQLKAKGRNQQD